MAVVKQAAGFQGKAGHGELFPGLHRRPPSSRKDKGRRLRGWFVWTAACLTIGVVLNAWAQQLSPTEHQVKAAFLYNFGRFVEWPRTASAPAGDPFSICLLGEDPFGPVLEETLEGKEVHGKKLLLRRIGSAKDTLRCQILFISSSEDSHLTEILTLLAGRSILTVSEMPRFAYRGGMIGFTLEQNKVRFEINPPAAERGGLIISSQLLKLAKIVNTKPPRQD